MMRERAITSNIDRQVQEVDWRGASSACVDRSSHSAQATPPTFSYESVSVSLDLEASNASDHDIFCVPSTINNPEQKKLLS